MDPKSEDNGENIPVTGERDFENAVVVDPKRQRKEALDSSTTPDIEMTGSHETFEFDIPGTPAHTENVSSQFDEMLNSQSSHDSHSVHG
ncbi:VirE2 family protein, partial [Rhizobium sp. BUS002]|nr:VirE2 family protein [Rhizobium phaseoli]